MEEEGGVYLVFAKRISARIAAAGAGKYLEGKYLGLRG
jgi:hypothetical protein